MERASIFNHLFSVNYVIEIHTPEGYAFDLNLVRKEKRGNASYFEFEGFESRVSIEIGPRRPTYILISTPEGRKSIKPIPAEETAKLIETLRKGESYEVEVAGHKIVIKPELLRHIQEEGLHQMLQRFIKFMRENWAMARSLPQLQIQGIQVKFPTLRTRLKGFKGKISGLGQKFRH